MNGRQDTLTYAILGAAFGVHRELGSGFLEAVHHEALVREFGLRDIRKSATQVGMDLSN
jgi:GxxExxY protein